MLEVEPGREDDFRYLSRWLAASDALDRVVEATERLVAPQPALIPAIPLKAAAQTAPVPGGLRARFAARLAAFAVGLHPQAAAGALHARCAEEPL